MSSTSTPPPQHADENPTFVDEITEENTSTSPPQHTDETPTVDEITEENCSLVDEITGKTEREKMHAALTSGAETRKRLGLRPVSSLNMVQPLDIGGSGPHMCDQAGNPLYENHQMLDGGGDTLEDLKKDWPSDGTISDGSDPPETHEDETYYTESSISDNDSEMDVIVSDEDDIVGDSQGYDDIATSDQT